METLFAINFDKNRVDSLSNLALAHIGDGVFELLSRSYLCCKGDSTVRTLHRDAVALVNAPSQAKFAEKLLPNTGGIGIYAGFVHIDVRKTKSRWRG